MLRFVVVLALAAGLAVGCSSSAKTATTTTTTAPAASPSTIILPGTNAPAVTSTTARSAPTTVGPVAPAGLTGTWSGKYSGEFSGTFTLTWTQKGPVLTGTIDLSTGGNDPVAGLVSGSKITFGTLGNGAIHYTGTVSGSDMSGTYKTTGGSGSWSATKA